MTNQTNPSDLRQKAEALARERASRIPEKRAALSPEEIQKTLHELRVHQIELEMQNEELRMAQAQVEAERDRYFDFYDLAPVGYWTLSEKGLILEANLTAATMLGLARGALIKQPISRFIFTKDLDIYYLHRKKLFEMGKPQEYDLRLVKPDGACFWVHLAGTVAQAEDGAPLCRVVVSDITERKQADEKLRETEKQLREATKLEAVGTLAGGIAHEFNNLLYIISGNVELLNDQLAAEDKEILQEIHQAAMRGADLVKQILTFSRKSEVNLQPVYLNLEISRIKKLLEKLLPRMIQINLELADDLPAIKGDSRQIEQILINLALNARDAMPEGGKLLIKTKTGLHEGQPSVMLSVSDTGCGIAPNHIARIFDPFFSTKRVGKGTGLGLSVTYGIIKAHQGFISCESEPGKGTTFTIFLPYAGPIEASFAKQTLAPVLAMGNETILVVDDETSIRNMAQKMLNRLGYNTLTAESGEDALAVYHAKSEPIHAIILDLGMPGMGGKQCMEKLIEFDPDVKVIISSGYAGEGLVRDMVACGAKSYLIKPYVKKDLSEKLRDVLDAD